MSFPLEPAIQALATAIGNDNEALRAADGTLSSLTTTEKTNLVGAINELVSSIAALLYSKQQPTEKNAPDIESTALDFDSHPAYQINMTADTAPTSMTGAKGVHGHLLITNNANGYDFDLASVANAMTFGTTTSEIVTLSAGMTTNTEFFVVAVYFYDTNKPVFTASPLAAAPA